LKIGDITVKRSIWLSIALLFLASFAAAQTTVTFQVTDADSQAWANAPYTVILSSTAASTPVGATAVVSGTTNVTGGASFTLTTATWTFRVCPQASSISSGTVGNGQVSCYSSSVAVAGGSQTVTLAPPAIRIPIVTGVAVFAYADAEVTGPFTGAKYFNLIDLVERSYNGAAWIDVSVSKIRAFSTLPACAAGTEGMRRGISDSTTIVWGATITGGSTNHVLAYCDGTNWTVAGK
jgi:hypothetical protein